MRRRRGGRYALNGFFALQKGQKRKNNFFENISVEVLHSMEKCDKIELKSKLREV